MANEKNNELLPAYLVVGDDALKREAVLKRLRIRLEKLGDLSFNFDEFDGETASGEAIVSACQTIPFASEKRLVLIDEAGKLKKADAEVVAEYLSAPSPSTVVALVAEKLAKNTKLYKAVATLGKTAVIDCSKPKKYELPKMVCDMARVHGITLTDGGARKLIELVGDDTVHIDNELDKLALSLGSAKPITDADITRLVAQVAEAKPWEFADAFASRDLSRCIRLKSLMPSASPHMLIGMCVSKVRELICVKSLAEKGSANPASIAAALGGVPDWKVKNHSSWASRFTSDELREALFSALTTERAMKSGTDPDDAFMDWVVATLKR